jgi:hypothetical protein
MAEPVLLPDSGSSTMRATLRTILVTRLITGGRTRVTAALAVLVACSDPTGPGAVYEDPAAAPLITTDLVNFWDAFDNGGREGSAEAFQGRYIDRASPGLREFIASRRVTAQSLAQMVRAYPRYFGDIRQRVLAFATNSPLQLRLRDDYARYRQLYPATVFVPATFVIGRFTTAGTTTGAGIIIGTEFFGGGEGTPTDELAPFQRDNALPLDSLPVVFAHEQVHILQARARRLVVKSGKTLLEQSLLEGSADFIGELVSGGNINRRLFTFAIPREAALWQEFREEMQGTSVGRWLYNQGQATPERPGDLGYFIGYRIAESYYARAADKTQAVRQIIEVADAPAFLAQSGYHAR